MCVFEYEYANVMGLYGAEKEREGKGEPEAVCQDLRASLGSWRVVRWVGD